MWGREGRDLERQKEPRLLLGRPQEGREEETPEFLLLPSYVLPGKGAYELCDSLWYRAGQNGGRKQLAFDQCKGQAFSSPAAMVTLGDRGLSKSHQTEFSSSKGCRFHVDLGLPKSGFQLL